MMFKIKHYLLGLLFLVPLGFHNSIAFADANVAIITTDFVLPAKITLL